MGANHALRDISSARLVSDSAIRQDVRMPGRSARGLLSQVRVTTPCHESWGGMQGDERERFCARCQKTVYDLSAMSEEEAHALLAQKRFGLCVRYQQRADGTIVHGSCPSPKGASSPLLISAAAAIVAGMGCAEQGADRPAIAQSSAANGKTPDAGFSAPAPVQHVMGEAVAAPVDDVGRLSPTVLNAVLQARGPALQRCCDRTSAAALSREIQVHLQIETSGTVRAANLLVDPALRECVQAEVTQWSFPKAERSSIFVFGFECENRKSGTRASRVRAPAARSAVRCTPGSNHGQLECQKGR